MLLPVKIYQAKFSFPVRLYNNPVRSNVLCIKYVCSRKHLYIVHRWVWTCFFDSRCSSLYFHINPLGKKINFNYIQRFSPYRSINTLHIDYKTSRLMLYREMIAVCSQIHTKHINTLGGQNVELHIKTQSVPRSKHTPSRL